MDNGADLCCGDLGEFACTAAEQNSLELLEDIIRYGGDITSSRSNGSTALHLAVCEGNVEVVKYLLDHGADMDIADINGWTPGDLADQQGHEEIKALFQAKKESIIDKSQIPPTPAATGATAASGPTTSEQPTVRFVGRFRSEPAIRVSGNGGGDDQSWGRNLQRRRKTNNFHNSLFGIMSAAQEGERNVPAAAAAAAVHAVGIGGGPPMMRSSLADAGICQRRAARVTVRCPQAKGSSAAAKVVLLPGTLDELLGMGLKKFGLRTTKVLTEEGAEVDDIAVIRDGDRLLLVC